MMTRRFLVEPAQDSVDYERQMPMTMVIHEAELAPPRFTGLVNASGHRIMAVEQKQPVGFVRFSHD